MRELAAALVALSWVAAVFASPGLYLAPYSERRIRTRRSSDFCESFTACDKDVSCVCSRGHGGNNETGTCPKCLSDEQCPDKLSCVQGKCMNPCLGRCGANTVCAVIDRKPICVCAPDHIGDPVNGCHRKKAEVCDSNAVCPRDKICIGQVCVDPCSFINCPNATVCQISNHTVNCINKPPDKAECTSNTNCPLDRTCLYSRCIDLCASNICGDNAECHVNKHRVTCVSKPIEKNECDSDKDCSSNKKCKGNKCYDPCEKNTACPENAECLVVKHILMCITTPIPGSCTSNGNCATDKTCILNKCVNPCENIFCENDGVCKIINHKVVCLPPDKNQCKSNEDCPKDKNCIDKKCVNPCDSGICGENKICEVIDRTVHCKPIPVGDEVCKVNDDCKSHKKCVDGACVDACSKVNCGVNKVCIADKHEATCHKKGECEVNTDCPTDRFCHDSKCVNPCLSPICGDRAICQVQDHEINCIAIGPDELVRCDDNDGCKSDKNCVDGICIDPCGKNMCGPKSKCQVVNHDIRCVRTGDGECSSSTDCKSNLVCTNQTCVDPCKTHVCGDNAICTVTNNTISCIKTKEPCNTNCKIDRDCDSDKACDCGDCVNPCDKHKSSCAEKTTCVVSNHVASCVDLEKQCAANTDCKGTSVCQEGKCVDLCVGKACGKNASCELVNSAAKCVCPLGFFGDADKECQKEGVGGNEIGDCSGNLFEKPVAPKVYHPVTDIKTNWHAAFMYCHAHGRRLAVVENKEENEKILSAIKDTEIKNSEFWVGGTDHGFEDRWKWMPTGLPISNFTYWHAARPWYNVGINCLHYVEYVGNKEGYRWGDAICTYKFYFVCEDFE